MRKVLFVGGGRRVELAKNFWDHGYDVYSYELNREVPISSIAEVIVGKEFFDQDFSRDIRDVVSERKIDLIVPLQDTATFVLSGMNDIGLFEDAKYLGPSREVSGICYDKSLFEKECLKICPNLYPVIFPNDYPIIAKPVFGWGSRGIFVINSTKEKEEFESTHDIKQYVYQRYISGKEYSVDAYFNKQRECVDAVPRERIRVAGGEVISSKTVKNKVLSTYTSDIGELFGIFGPANFQYIKDEYGNFNIFEINCRFAGGMTLSMYAGFDMISLVGKDLFGDKCNYKVNSWEKEILMERSYRDHFFRV